MDLGPGMGGGQSGGGGASELGKARRLSGASLVSHGTVFGEMSQKYMTTAHYKGSVVATKNILAMAEQGMNSRYSDMFKAFQYVDLDRSGLGARSRISVSLPRHLHEFTFTFTLNL